MRRALALALLFAGACLIAFPAVSGMVSASAQHDEAARYEAIAASEESRARIDAVLAAAVEYNSLVASGELSYATYGDEYWHQLALPGTDAISVLRIDEIGVELPIYLGTEEDSLAQGVGHLPGSSLPIGGESTHCVLLGHTGLATSELLTALDELRAGDRFELSTLGMRLCYEVASVKVVNPEDVESLCVTQGADECTLVTCTPYGVNTQRLLVTGVRVAAEAEASGEPDLGDFLLIAQGSVLFWLALAALAILALLGGVIRVRRSRFVRRRRSHDFG